ncbi:MAG: glycosyltransferase [Thermoanaerobaculia bacterium]
MVHVRDYLADQTILRSERAPVHPAVSVALPTWRRYATGALSRALDSVLDQSFRDLELIVVDDGSTDGTWDYLRGRQAQDSRLVLIRHEGNSGLPAIRVNEAIELSRGDYLAFQFDDDEWLDGTLEMLVARAESLSAPAVVHGEALLVFPDGRQERSPGFAVDLRHLFRQNRIANNSVLIPRAVLERYGLFDCHIAMRRICDWDLWLRLVRNVPFVAANGLVARVRVSSDAASVGRTAPYDLSLVRFLMTLPRNELLSLERWRDYEVDALCVAGVEVPPAFRNRLVAEQIGPYFEQPDLSDSIRAKRPVLRAEPPPGPRTLSCVLDGSYPSTDLCFGHYDDQTRSRRTYVRFEQLVDQMAPTWPTETDLLLLVRTVTEPAPEVARRAVAEGIPSAYYLDDDFLSLHEYGPPFDNFAPGQPAHANLVSALRQVDAVWATSPVIAESVRPHNPRIVPHNGAVAEAWLPTRLRPRGVGGRVRIAHTGSGYRAKEFELVWEGLRQVAHEFSDLVEFEFWGVDVSDLPALEAPSAQIPYIHSYPEFMTRLRGAGLDILLTPLLDSPRPRLAKSPSKYYQVAAAGALGIFSDVPPYAGLPHGLTCLKAANTPEAWYEALCEALRMPDERFDAMRRRTIEHVRLEFTETAQIHLHEAACRATELHSRTRGHRHPDGRPRILLLAPEDREPPPELQAVLRRYSIEPVAAPCVGEREGSPAARELEQWLAREKPALAIVPRGSSAVARECAEHGVPAVIGPDVVLSQDSFNRGLERLLRDIAPEDGRRLVVAIRQGVDGPSGTSLADHPEAPEVRRLDSGGTVDLSQADILVAPAREKALLARAAAEGVLLVSVSAPGPLPVDGVSGIVCPDSSAEAVARGIRRALDLTAEERLGLRTAAYRAARAQAHPDAVASELLRGFNDVWEKAAAKATHPAPPPPPPTAGPVVSPVARPSAKTVLKRALDRVGLFRPLSRLTWLARRKRVLVVYEDLFASERFHREVLGELEAATRRTWIFQPAREIDSNFLYSFQTVILVRGTSVRSLQILEAARASGCATLYDADDNLLLLAQFIPDPANEWRRKYDPARGQIEAMLTSVDAVKVYSEAAASIFRRLNPNVVVIRAYQRVTRTGLPARRPGAPVTVGFLGTPYKDEEFATLVPAIARLLDEGRPLRFELFGFGPKALAAREEVTVHPWERDYRKYREKLDGLGWDVGVAPLRDTEFNQCKSNAKYREYAASGIAGIYSDARIYRDTVADRKTGLIVPHDSTQAWYDAILELATDESLRTALAARAFEDVRTNYRPEDYVRRVADLVESLRPRRG